MKWLNVVLDMLLALAVSLYYVLERAVLLIIPVQWHAKDISGEVALVTGGGSGLGRLTAQGLAKLGAIVVVLDVNQEANLETAKQVTSSGGRAFAYQCDVSDREDVYRVCERVKKEVGDVTILVNNAGIVNGRELMETPDDMIEKVFKINTLAHFWTVKAFLPAMMKKNHGHVVTIASLAGYVGISKLVDYCVSKFAAVGFDESLKSELFDKGYDGIHTTSICPFYINTGMFEGVKSKVIPILEPEYVAQRIIDAILTNEDVVFLPRSCLILLIFKMMFPTKCMAIAGKSVGFFEMMAQFKGRQSSSTEETETTKERQLRQ